MICAVRNLGLTDYPSALAAQMEAHSAVKRGMYEGIILFAEHMPCITLGRASSNSDRLNAEKERASQSGLHIYISERGGRLTYHAPGQLLAYPVLSLNLLGRDVHRYLRNLERTVIYALKIFDIGAHIKDGYTGVWVDEKKIASIGVAVSGWITFHGLALNVKPVMEDINYAAPCGLKPNRYTSIEENLRHSPCMNKVRENLLYAFKEVFGIEYSEEYRLPSVA